MEGVKNCKLWKIESYEKFEAMKNLKLWKVGRYKKLEAMKNWKLWKIGNYVKLEVIKIIYFYRFFDGRKIFYTSIKMKITLKNNQKYIFL